MVHVGGPVNVNGRARFDLIMNVQKYYIALYPTYIRSNINYSIYFYSYSQQSEFVPWLLRSEIYNSPNRQCILKSNTVIEKRSKNSEERRTLNK